MRPQLGFWVLGSILIISGLIFSLYSLNEKKFHLIFSLSLTCFMDFEIHVLLVLKFQLLYQNMTQCQKTFTVIVYNRILQKM